MPSSEPRGVGELGRNLEALTVAVEKLVDQQATDHREVLARFDALPTNFQTREVAFLQREALEGEIARLAIQVNSLQSWQDWAVKLVLAFVVLGVLGAVLKFTQGG
jgi:hypothetical protein